MVKYIYICVCIPNGSQKPKGACAPIASSNDILNADEDARVADGANADAPTKDANNANALNIFYIYYVICNCFYE